MRIKIAALAAVGIFVLGMAMPADANAQSCKQLRWACENKQELGIQGAGACRRYREACGGGGGDNHCEKLRYACENKEELGLEGAGTCRRYREECGGGGRRGGNGGFEFRLF